MGFACSFCGWDESDGRAIICGPAVYICTKCVDLCNDIIRYQLIGPSLASKHEADIAMMAWEGTLPEDEEVFDAQPRKTIPADEVADRLAETCCERGEL